jgi:hypothetical protein
MSLQLPANRLSSYVWLATIFLVASEPMLGPNARRREPPRNTCMQMCTAILAASSSTTRGLADGWTRCSQSLVAGRSMQCHSDSPADMLPIVRHGMRCVPNFLALRGGEGRRKEGTEETGAGAKVARKLKISGPRAEISSGIALEGQHRAPVAGARGAAGADAGTRRRTATGGGKVEAAHSPAAPLPESMRDTSPDPEATASRKQSVGNSRKNARMGNARAETATETGREQDLNPTHAKPKTPTPRRRQHTGRQRRSVRGGDRAIASSEVAEEDRGRLRARARVREDGVNSLDGEHLSPWQDQDPVLAIPGLKPCRRAVQRPGFSWFGV